MGNKSGGIADDPKAIGGRIREGREALGLTQKQFAEGVGVSEISVSVWERGVSTLNRENLGRVATVLGTTEAALRYGSAYPPPSPSEPRSVAESHITTLGRPKLPPRAYERVYGYTERMRAAGIPEEMIEESERLMAVPVFSKLNKRDVRERSEEDLVTDIDAAWAWIREIVQREWGITL